MVQTIDAFLERFLYMMERKSFYFLLYVFKSLYFKYSMKVFNITLYKN